MFILNYLAIYKQKYTSLNATLLSVNPPLSPSNETKPPPMHNRTSKSKTKQKLWAKDAESTSFPIFFFYGKPLKAILVYLFMHAFQDYGRSRTHLRPHFRGLEILWQRSIIIQPRFNAPCIRSNSKIFSGHFIGVQFHLYRKFDN